MKKTFFTILLASLCCQVFGQANLVSNPSFEINNGIICGWTTTQPGFNNMFTASWTVPHGGTSDIHSRTVLQTCWNYAPNSTYNGFSCWPGGQMPRTGDVEAGIFTWATNSTWREYVQNQLTQPMTVGATYEVEFYVSLADLSINATNNLGAYFSTTITQQANFGNLPFIPQVNHTTPVTDTVGWTAIRDTIVCTAPWQYVIIGNFYTTANTQLVVNPGGNCLGSYYYVDDVSVREINPQISSDTTICPGDTVELWAQGDSPYSWITTVNPTPFATGDTISVAPTVTTSYIAVGQNGQDTVTVTVLPAPPVLTLQGDTTICQGDSVVLNAGNQSANVSFLWSTGDTAQTITVGTDTTYWVVAQNSCGWDSSGMTLTVVPPPTPSLGVDTAVCFGNSVTLDAGSGYSSYSWSTSANTQTITVTTTGTYSVTVENLPGCAGSDTVNITVAAQLQLTPSGVDVSCNGGSDGSVSVVAQGSAPFIYLWSTGAGTPSVNNLTAGTYTVTVTDAIGCQATASVTLNEPPAMTSTMSVSHESCPGDSDGTAIVTAAGGQLPYTYTWSSGGNTAFVQGLAAGMHTVTVTDANGCTVEDTAIINPAAAVSVNINGTAAFCEGEGGDTLFASASGGVSPYYFTWWCNPGFCGLDSINDDDPIANPDTSKWYYVQVTDNRGCTSNIDSIWVEVIPKPVVDAGPDLWLCGDNAPCQVLTPTVTGTGPFEYLWIPGRGLNDSTILNPCARPDTTTIYTLVVTDLGTGCTSDFNTTDTLSTVTVHVNPIPIANAGPDIHVCVGDSGQLQAFGTGAGPNYTFQWSPTNGLSNPSVAAPMASPSLTTEYTLVVWSNNCPSYGDQVIVNVHTQPTVDAGQDREICLGDSTLLDATAGGDSTASYSFSWSPAAGLSDPLAEDPMASPAVTTLYFATATSNYGCGSATDSVLVTLLATPVAEAGLPVTMCEGDTIGLEGNYAVLPQGTQFNPSDVYASWTPGNTMSDTTQLMPSIWPTTSQWYWLTTTHGTCSTTDSVFVTVIPEIIPEAWADTNVACAGVPVGLHATGGQGGATYTWTPAAGLDDPTSQNPIATPDSTTTYTVWIEESGCGASAQVTVEIIPTPAAAALSSLTSGCAPLTVSFLDNSSDVIKYVWDFGDGSPISNHADPVHTYENPGTYTVTLTAINIGGCMDQTTVEINVTEPGTAEFTSDPAFPIELSLPNTNVQFFDQSQGATSWSWDFGDGQASNEVNPFHQYNAPGEYTVTLTIQDQSGCISSVQHGPYVIFTPELFIPNVFSPNDDGINDTWLVEYSGSQPVLIQIFDRWGVELYNSRNKNSGWNGLNTDNVAVPEGVYFYTVRVGDREFTGNVSLFR